MAIRYAVASGNWSNTATWNGGTLPTSADDVYSNTFTVTIDISPTVLSVRNTAATGVTAGGTFVPTAGITLTCTGTGIIAGPSACFISSLTTGQSCSLAANVSGSSTGNVSGYGVANNSTGDITIIGNVTGGFDNTSGIINNLTGTVNIIGNVTGGTATNGRGVINQSSGTVNITGNVSGSSIAAGGAVGAFNNSTGTINITGSVTGGNNSTSPGANNNSTGILNVTGNAVAHPTSNANGIINSSSGQLVHVGTAQASSSAAISGTSLSQVTILSGPFLTSSLGVHPVYCARWFWANSNVTPTYYQIRTANLATIRPLYTADSVGGNPAVTNVRSGTVYGPAGELTGTCAVPPAQSVSYGVPVDNTTGTAYLSQADIVSIATTALSAASAITLSQPITSIGSTGSIGERLKNTATIASVSQQISDVFSTRQ